MDFEHCRSPVREVRTLVSRFRRRRDQPSIDAVQVAATERNTEAAREGTLASRKNTRALHFNTTVAVGAALLVVAGIVAQVLPRDDNTFEVVRLSVVDDAPTEVIARGNFASSPVIHSGVSGGVDVSVANNTDVVVLLTKVRIRIVESTPLPNCTPTGGPLEASTRYGIQLPERPEQGIEVATDTSQEVRPQTADRFVVSIGRSVGTDSAPPEDAFLIRVGVVLETHVSTTVKDVVAGEAYIQSGTPHLRGTGNAQCEKDNVAALRLAFERHPDAARSQQLEKTVRELSSQS